MLGWPVLTTTHNVVMVLAGRKLGAHWLHLPVGGRLLGVWCCCTGPHWADVVLCYTDVWPPSILSILHTPDSMVAVWRSCVGNGKCIKIHYLLITHCRYFPYISHVIAIICIWICTSNILAYIYISHFIVSVWSSQALILNTEGLGNMSFRR